jgi:hypothetical protein
MPADKRTRLKWLTASSYALRDCVLKLSQKIASMVALYIALKLELPRPYWAMASVYVVANPFVGATRSKAVYRAVGTAIGAAAAALLLPHFVEEPFVFSAIAHVLSRGQGERMVRRRHEVWPDMLSEQQPEGRYPDTAQAPRHLVEFARVSCKSVVL